MKNKKGFTLIELLAVIILIGLIALIVTPKITKVLKTQKMNIFKESVEGLIKAVKEDAVNNAGFNSTTSSNYRAYIYDGSGLYLTVAGNQAADADIKISGSIDNGQGTVVVTKDTDIVLAVYNDKFCAKKNADDTAITVEDYTGSCVNDEIDIPEASSCFTYENNPDNTLTITGYDYDNATCSKNLVIPNRINGKQVSKLADLAFVDAEDVIAEYMEADVDGNYHWYEEFLENIPSDKVMTWMTTTSTSNINGKYCYTDMDENNSVVVALNYIHTTGDGYYGCYYDYVDWDLTGENGYQLESIDFSNATGITEIPFGLVAYSSIESINIGNYVTKINSTAFANNFITSLTIPRGVQQISTFAFQRNPISSLDLTNASALKYIDDGAFEYNSIGEVELPDSLTTVGSYTFSDNSISNLDIPENLLSIGGFAFSENQISSLNFTNASALEYIEEGAFSENNLDTLTIENLNNLISINGGDWGAFEANGLTSVTLRNLPNLTNIGNLDDEYGPFNYNDISTLVLDNLPSLKTIGSFAFIGNSLASVTIPASVESIGEYSFDRCSCVEDPSNPALATIINQTGRSFDWSSIIGEGTPATCSFVTGTCSAVNITS